VYEVASAAFLFEKIPLAIKKLGRSGSFGRREKSLQLAETKINFPARSSVIIQSTVYI
jgi:hypothetical protein